MAEYIEKEALVHHFMTKRQYLTKDLVMDAAYEVSKFSTADVAPVVHGRWIPCEPDSDVRFYCSECGTEISTSWDYDCDEMWNGCPHCLARMDGE